VQAAARFTARNPDLVAGWKVAGRHCVALANDACVEAATAALAKLRGGQDAAREIARAAAARDRVIARLSPEMRGVAFEILRGQARLGPAVDRMLRTGGAADAEALARALIAIDPQDSLAPVLLGDALLKRGDRAGGERQLRASLAKFPGQPRAYADLARLRFDHGDKAGAFAVMTQGLDRMKGHPTLLKALARLQERSGQATQAIATYRSLLQSAPDDMIAINNLAALLTDYGARPQALGEAELLARRLLPADNPAFLDTRGWLKLQRGERAEAVRLLRRAVAGEGSLPVFHYHLAAALAASGDRAGARAEAARAVAGAEPGEPWLNKARALMEQT
jgi:predicted Zn-dependent protease